MNIYVAHSREFDFVKELYQPLRQSSLNSQHTIVLPHEKSSHAFDSKEYFKNDCDLILAEATFPSTGMGIELSWGNLFDIPIIALYKLGASPSSSAVGISKMTIEYSEPVDMIEKIEKAISTYQWISE